MKAPVISLTVSALLALLGAGCVTDIGDAVCTPDSVATDKDDKCPYGAPGGPKPEIRPSTDQPECEGIAPAQDAANCTNTWADNAFPAFQQMKGVGCASGSGCHGAAPGKAQFYMPDADPGTSYTNLTAYISAKTGKPYLDPLRLQESYVLCNLRGDVGKPMPPAEGVSDTDPNYLIIQSWASCGAPLTGTGGPPP